MDVRDIFAHRMDDRFTRLDIAVPNRRWALLRVSGGCSPLIHHRDRLNDNEKDYQLADRPWRDNVYEPCQKNNRKLIVRMSVISTELQWKQTI